MNWSDVDSQLDKEGKERIEDLENREWNDQVKLSKEK